ncbi:MAG: hypothetical protein ABEJ92_00910 [Halobacteriales archaeon]
MALTVQDVVGVVYRALRSPVTEAQAEPSFGAPWWVGIAVQGHLLGLFLGITVGAAVLDRRAHRASRLWAGTLLVSTSLSLWALWWYRGSGRFVLYRGLGVVLVFALALLVTVGVLATHADWSLPELDVPARHLGLLLLVFPVLVVGMAAVPLNLSTVADDSAPGDGPAIQVRDYTVVYAENVTNQLTSVVNLTVLGETTRVRTSGVIVVSGERHLWTQAVSTGRLDFAGREGVVLGGPGWRKLVVAARDGWDVAGNGTAYRVFLRRGDGPRRLAFTSPGRTADPVLAGRRIAVEPEASGYFIEVRRNGSTLAHVPMPAVNETVAAAGITFERQGDRLVAAVDGTRVRIASQETYRGRR